MNVDDPILTAYALDELPDEEKARLQAEVTRSPEAQRHVAELREFAQVLKAAYQTERETESSLRPARLIDIRGDRWLWSIARPLALAALLAVAAVVAGLVISSKHRMSYALADSTGGMRQLPTGMSGSPADGRPSTEVEGEFPAEEPDSAQTSVPAAKPVPPANAQPHVYEEREMVTGGVRRLAGIARDKNTAGLSSTKVRANAPVGGEFDNEQGTFGLRQRSDGFNTAAYDHLVENPFLDATANPLSTFSIDVDTASYSNIRRFVNEGRLPPKDAVRLEEMINYFTYDYPQPADGKPFSITVDVAGCPWEAAHRLVRIGLKGREIAVDKRGASNLVFLLDVSGSMTPAERLPLIKKSMRLLVEKLTESDRVAIVVYAGASGLALPSTTGDHKDQILSALEKLQPGGSTNGAQGIELAYRVAAANFIQGGVNRVILATDGDFNVGVTSQGDLLRMIERKAKTGVFLSVLGVGTDNLKDSTMQKLADKGNGNYAYLDSLDEARKVLVQQMNGTLVTLAKDVKIQVEFNPARVASYRLIGYEKRMLRKEDFNNDKIDAGEIGAGHSVTALYEVVPAGSGSNPAASVPPVDPLKYSRGGKSASGTSTGSNEMLTVKLRHKAPEGEKSELTERVLLDGGTEFANASPDLKFAAAVAEFGMLLRDSEHKGNGSFGAVLEWAQEGKGSDPNGYRAGFIELVRKAQSLTKG